MAHELSDESSGFLSTLPAGRDQQRLALTIVLVSAALFLCTAPFAKVPLAQIPAFVPIYESALVINDLIIAVLLFGQFSILRSRALFVLASGYLFTAFLAFAHALTFPGLFSVTGLLGAGLQSTAWLYMFWHGSFPLCVIAYALLKDEGRPIDPPSGRTRVAVLFGVAVVITVAGGFTLLATAGEDVLPAIMQDNHYTPAMITIVASVWALSLLALAVLWRRRPHTLLDLWLMVVMCAWLFDIALSAVLNGGRFDLGFYAGRIYGLLAASFVLLVLLLENSVLYVRLATAHEGARQKAVELERLHAQFERRAEERSTALETLKIKKEEIRAIVENMLDCVITIDTRGIVRSTNPALERVLGFTAAEVVGHNVSMLMPEPHRGAHDSYLGNYLRTGEARIIGIGREVEGLHKDGRLIPLELSISEYEVRGEHFFIGTLRDIRERKRFIGDLTQARADAERRAEERAAALEALNTKEEEIRAIVENMLDCVITIDTRGIVRSTNPALERVLGFTAAEVVGHNVSMLMPEPHRGAHDSYLGNYLRTGEARIIGIGREVEGLHKDGRLIPLELSISEYEVRGEHFFIGTLRDIRERKRFIAELTQARADAEQANRAKSDFLAAMSHEIRTPMNGVIGMIDVLHQTSLKGYQVEMADLIRDSAYSLLTIIDDILDFSKIEAGKLEIERTPMVVADVVEKVCGLLDRLAEVKGVKLTLFTDPEIPENVLGDALRLRQVLVNLANNAVKFSSGSERAGRVAVRAVLAERSPERIVVEIQVTDNGIGMDEETLARLFTPFGQADVSTTRRFGGTGLGLAISQHLVGLMGGEITVHSAPGEGSTFTARLPFVPLPGTVDAGAALMVAGLSCLVVGGTEGMAADLAVYLVHGGALVEQAPDLAAAGERAVTLAPGLWVWVIATGGEPPSAEELYTTVRARADLEICFVAIGYGERRQPRAVATDLVRVDGNVLTRRMLLRAVAIAAGRIVEEAAPQHAGKVDGAIRPPSRDEALRTGRLILVAEDNETNQKVILQQLNLLGFAADIVSNGREVLERLPGADYAVLLTDLHMPQMDGYQVTTAIRAEEKGTRRLPIIALTANALKDEATRCRAVGMDDYLSKPARLADLKAMLEKWLPAVVESRPDRALPPVAPLASGDHQGAVDVSVLAALVGDDPQVIREFLQDFRGSAAKAMAELKRACAAGEAAEVSAEAHKLKSSARSVGALALGELCAKLEATGKTSRNAELTAHLLDFEVEMARVDAYLGAFLVQPSA